MHLSLFYVVLLVYNDFFPHEFLMLPNGQEIKLNVQRFCRLVYTDITFVILKFWLPAPNV